MSGDPPQEVVLVRHAETEWSKTNRHTGRIDLPLTEQGAVEAAKLRPILTGRPFAQVLVSPLQRALETARLGGLDLDACDLDADLVEWDYGDYEGRTALEVRAERPDWVLWSDGAPGGEQPADVAARADRIVERITAVDGDVCVVAHGHFLRMLTARWLELEPGFGRRLPLPPAHWSVLGWERGARVLRRWAAGPTA